MLKDHIDKSIAENEIRIDFNNEQYDPGIENFHLGVENKDDERTSSIDANRKNLKWKFVLLPAHLYAWIPRKDGNNEAQSKHNILSLSTHTYRMQEPY